MYLKVLFIFAKINCKNERMLSCLLLLFNSLFDSSILLKFFHIHWNYNKYFFKIELISLSLSLSLSLSFSLDKNNELWSSMMWNSSCTSSKSGKIIMSARVNSDHYVGHKCYSRNNEKWMNTKHLSIQNNST